MNEKYTKNIERLKFIKNPQPISRDFRNEIESLFGKKDLAGIGD